MIFLFRFWLSGVLALAFFLMTAAPMVAMAREGGFEAIAPLSSQPAQAPVPPAEPALADCPLPPAPYNPTPAQLERDHIFSLLAYSVVSKDWQTAPDGPGVRGYNIGSVLVDGNNKVVCWARNSVDVTENETQHGEVRLMTNYLRNTKQFSLRGYRLYTTLEPCAMCAGMMTLTELYATIYGQSDPGFGHALARLQLNSSSIGGYCPYPRPVLSVAAKNQYRERLDEAYAKAPKGTHITAWLTHPEIREIYEEAYQALLKFSPEHDENVNVLASAKAFLESVPDHYTAIPYEVACPPK